MPFDFDPTWQRPVRSRYLDPLELVWLATARRLGITIRRDPAIFSMTDGSGRLWLGPREDLDADDTLAQQVYHELCHWITNGLDTFHERDWGFPVDDVLDLREFACLRLQAWLAETHGLRAMFGPTGIFRQYYDRLPADPFAPLDDSPEDAVVVALALEARDRAEGPPWVGPLHQALAATAALRGVVHPFLRDYATELEQDELPSLWAE